MSIAEKIKTLKNEIIPKVHEKGEDKGIEKFATYIEGEQDKIIALQESIINGTWDGTMPEFKVFAKEEY